MCFKSVQRRGFTLVELLVVIAVIAALAGIMVVFLPKREVRLANQGADQAQTYIASAKSRALRDRVSRGVRLISQDGGNTFRELQYIEVPEPYQPEATLYLPMNPMPPAQVVASIIGADVTDSILYGDMLEITQGNGGLYRIQSVSFNAMSNTSSVTLIPSSAPAVSQTAPFFTAGNYRFIREPRPLLGEPTLQLPETVYIQGLDYTAFVSGSNPTGWPGSVNIPLSYDGNNSDIIFGPSGAVVNATGGRIVLVMMDDHNVSQPNLLTIYCRTGGVAVHPKGPAGSEYSYTQDGRSSGQ
jgi:prepilin-type N-terminal cleavage/methylation domain-containing protein